MLPTTGSLPEGMATLLAVYGVWLANGSTTVEFVRAPRLNQWLADLRDGWSVLYGEPCRKQSPSLRMRRSPLPYRDADQCVAGRLTRWCRLGRLDWLPMTEAAVDSGSARLVRTFEDRISGEPHSIPAAALAGGTS